MVAGNNDDIEVSGNLGHPIILLKGVMQIGNK